MLHTVFDLRFLCIVEAVYGANEISRDPPDPLKSDALTDFVKRPQVGAGGMVYIKYNADGSFKSSVDKFYTQDDLKAVADKFGAKPGDLMLVLCGPAMKTRVQLCALRLEVASQLGLRNPEQYDRLPPVGMGRRDAALLCHASSVHCAQTRRRGIA